MPGGISFDTYTDGEPFLLFFWSSNLISASVPFIFFQFWLVHDCVLSEKSNLFEACFLHIFLSNYLYDFPTGRCWLCFFWFIQFIQTHALGLCQENNNLDQIPVKFLIVILSLVRELQMMQDRVAEYRSTVRTKSESRALELMDQFGQPDALNLYQKFTNVFILIMVWGTNWTKLVNFFLYNVVPLRVVIDGSSICLACRRSWCLWQTCPVLYSHMPIPLRWQMPAFLVQWKENLEALVNAVCHPRPPPLCCKRYDYVSSSYLLIAWNLKHHLQTHWVYTIFLFYIPNYCFTSSCKFSVGRYLC